MNQYVGTLINLHVLLTIPNDQLLYVYLENQIKARDVTPNLLTELTDNMRQEFGNHLDLSFFDMSTFETMDSIEVLTPFHLLVTLKPDCFYSREIH